MVKHAITVERLHKLAADTEAKINQVTDRATYTVEYICNIVVTFSTITIFAAFPPCESTHALIAWWLVVMWEMKKAGRHVDRGKGIDWATGIRQQCLEFRYAELHQKSSPHARH